MDAIYSVLVDILGYRDDSDVLQSAGYLDNQSAIIQEIENTQYQDARDAINVFEPGVYGVGFDLKSKIGLSQAKQSEVPYGS
jgi:hypothetical protein